MLFNSLEFAFFLPLALIGYYLCIPRSRWTARKWFLIVASYLFYMSWNPAFGLLLLTSTVLDFTLGLLIERAATSTRRKLLVAVSVVVNLGILAVFKYGQFALDTAGIVLRPFFGVVDLPAFDVALPVGISFYTFESLSYSIDVYRGMPAYRSLRDFALFLSFFPHLVAGPIVRPAYFLSQLGARPIVTGPQVELALVRIAQGLIKKMIFADALGEYVDQFYANPGAYGTLNAFLVLYAYAFQIYCDFSGYSDIALGVAELFGLHLPENFDRPYTSSDPREFWQRWHISLSTWLRDYLYVPLGGNRGGAGRTYVNLWLTMLLGGLWHGAAWNFVVWGGLHGAWLAVHRALSRGRTVATTPAVMALKRLGTFHVVCIAWVFFRSESMAKALSVLEGLVRPAATVTTSEATVAVVLVALAIVFQAAPSGAVLRARFVRLPAVAQGVAYGLSAIALFLLAPATERFIYFQF